MDLNFDKPKKQPQCINCDKPKGDHHARTMACPLGMKHKVVGYTQFSGTSFFDASPLPQHGGPS